MMYRTPWWKPLLWITWAVVLVAALVANAPAEDTVICGNSGPWQCKQFHNGAIKCSTTCGQTVWIWEINEERVCDVFIGGTYQGRVNNCAINGKAEPPVERSPWSSVKRIYQ